tara:strand:- start:28 stop:618 length:591 start_codon:yes stop_codon:yes gene_type:complete
MDLITFDVAQPCKTLPYRSRQTFVLALLFCWCPYLVVGISLNDPSSYTCGTGTNPSFCMMDNSTFCKGSPHEFRLAVGDDDPFQSTDWTNSVTGGSDELAQISLSFFDYDGDGLLDAAGGTWSGWGIFFLKNEGTKSKPKFVQKTGAENPFNAFRMSYRGVVVFADLDQDGHMDLWVISVKHTGGSENKDSYTGSG